MPGPYTIRRNALSAKYRWKAENIVRFFDKLGMSTGEKVKFLSEELAGAYMQAEMDQAGIRLLGRTRSSAKEEQHGKRETQE